MQRITVAVTLIATPGTFNALHLAESVQSAIMTYKDNNGLTSEDCEACVMDVELPSVEAHCE